MGIDNCDITCGFLKIKSKNQAKIKIQQEVLEHPRPLHGVLFMF